MPSALDLLLSRLRRDMENAEAPLRSQLVLVYESAIAELEHDLFNVTWLIEDALSRGEDITPDWLYRQDRYQRLIAKAETQMARFTDEALPLIEHTNFSGARLGARHVSPLLEAAGIQASFGTSINTGAVETIVQNMFRAGPIRDVLDSYGGNVTAVIRHEMAQGIIQGKSPREVVRRIQDTLASGTNRARLTALTRTEMMRSYRISQQQQLEEYAHAIKAYRWSAAHQSRTCLACMYLSGTESPEPRGKNHISCRCIEIPVGHYTPARYRRETGAEWLAAQPEATQRGMFPSQASYEAYKRGELPLSAFVGEKHSDVWGTSITQLSGKQAMANAGIVPGGSGPISSVPAGGFSSVDDAAAWFNSQGISTEINEDADVWTLSEVARGYDREIRSGAPVPSRLEFYRGRANDQSLAGYSFDFDNPGNGQIRVNTRRFNSAEIDEQHAANAALDSRWIVGTDPQSLISHEVAHYRHFSTAESYTRGGLNLTDGRRIPFKYGSKRKQKAMAGEMSQYAAESPLEFVAETYTALRNGEDVPQHLLDLFDEFGGVWP